MRAFLVSQPKAARFSRLLGPVLVLFAASLLITTSTPTPAIAQSYDIPWWTIDSGGAMNMTGGGFSLSGTTGQYDAGVMTGGEFTLHGGFWSVGPPEPTSVRHWQLYN